jgi:hypothetical protein
MIVLQNTITSLLWLANNNFNISFEIFFSTLVYNTKGSLFLYLIIFVTLFLGFIIAFFMQKIIPLNNSLSFSLSGFISLYVMIQITLYVFDNMFVISSVREWYGLFLFCLIGMFGGYIFNHLKYLFFQKDII